MTASLPEKQTRRPRTPKSDIIFHLAAWWMGGGTPESYAELRGVDVPALKRWIRAHSIFKTRSGGVAKRSRRPGAVRLPVAPCRFVTMKVIDADGGESC